MTYGSKTHCIHVISTGLFLHQILLCGTRFSPFPRSEIARRVAQASGALLAPALPYGFKSKAQSGGGEGFQGTFSLNGSTLIALVQDLLSAFIRKGFKKIFILNWHIENVEFVHEGLNLTMERHPDTAKIVVLDNPNGLVDPAILAALFADDFPGWEKEHAAIFETSMMLALRPELVRETLIQDDEAALSLPYAVYPTPPAAIPASGVLWHASKASQKLGQDACASMVDAIVRIIASEFPHIATDI